MRMAIVVPVIASSVLAAACSTGAGDAPAAVDGPVTDDTVFYEIAVQVGPGGVVVSEPHAITAREERAQNQARLDGATSPPGSIAIAVDPYCAGPSLWFYDQPNTVGNRVCFSGTGVLDLADVPRGRLGGDWRISQGSLWPGVSAGGLATELSIDAAASVINFPSWGEPQNFDVGRDRVRWLNLY